MVVNNAGYRVSAAIEELSEEQARRQIEVNVMGALWVTQAALPILREQGSGWIVQVSSIGRQRSVPLTGIYHASKWALEGFSETLRQEVEPFGVKVLMVEPSGFRTDWAGSSMTRAEPIDAYQQIDFIAKRRQAQAEDNNGKQPGNPELAAQALPGHAVPRRPALPAAAGQRRLRRRRRPLRAAPRRVPRRRGDCPRRRRSR